MGCFSSRPLLTRWGTPGPKSWIENLRTRDLIPPFSKKPRKDGAPSATVQLGWATRPHFLRKRDVGHPPPTPPIFVLIPCFHRVARLDLAKFLILFGASPNFFD